VDRRWFLLTSLAGTLPAPFGAGEQQPAKVYRIGLLRQGQPPKAFVEGFEQGLRERGYVEGQNLVVAFRYT
jgi:putative ABC transport system substrate-binding protein